MWPFLPLIALKGRGDLKSLEAVKIIRVDHVFEVKRRGVDNPPLTATQTVSGHGIEEFSH